MTITLISLVINTMAFLLVFNWSYIQKKRVDPNYPSKPIAKSVLFPVGLGIAFTILVDAYKGIIYYQFLLFLAVAAVLFWVIYGNKPKGN